MSLEKKTKFLFQNVAVSKCPGAIYKVRKKQWEVKNRKVRKVKKKYWEKGKKIQNELLKITPQFIHLSLIIENFSSSNE